MPCTKFPEIIVYFNRELKEYKVDNADKTSDYLSYNDFDGVEVILEPNCQPELIMLLALNIPLVLF